MKILKRLLCKHRDSITVTNLYGDAIIAYGCRSIRICRDCGKMFKSEILDKDSNIVNFEEVKKK